MLLPTVLMPLVALTAGPALDPRCVPSHNGLPVAVYPDMSRRRGETGRVRFELTLLPSGEVLDAQVVASSGFARLDRAALEAVQKWKVHMPAGCIPRVRQVSSYMDFWLE